MEVAKTAPTCVAAEMVVDRGPGWVPYESGMEGLILRSDINAK